jgi:hypothetical protein
VPTRAEPGRREAWGGPLAPLSPPR